VWGRVLSITKEAIKGEATGGEMERDEGFPAGFAGAIKHDRVVLYPHVQRDIGLDVTLKVASILKQYAKYVVICPVLEDMGDIKLPPSDFKYAKFEDELEDADMIITLGGDGTILRAARTAADYEVPILGINMGSKGFMAELETDEIEMVSLVASGAFEIETRMMLDAQLLRQGEVIHDDFALNDVVIRGYNKVIDLTLYGDGQIISSFVGDGAVIATPTGSTAYSMSAGGPIVEPTSHSIIVTPICAHVLEAKPFVLVSERHVTIELGHEKNSPAYISCDGCDRIELLSGDVVNVNKSKKSTRLVRLSGKSFYSKVSEKLRER